MRRKALFISTMMMVSSMVHSFGQSVASGFDSNASVYKRGETYLENTLPPSPGAASVTKYADIPVLYSTGVAQIEIPFHTLKGNELSIPVGLSYTCGGIKLDEVAGAAGLGWTLEAGGCITRTVMDMPDEFVSPIMQHKLPSDNLLEKLLDEDNQDTDKLNYLTKILLHRYDSQLDRYSYSVCGLSGSFVIRDNGVVYQLSGSGVKISCTRGSDNQITSFTIVGPDGTCYQFSEKEIGTHNGTNGQLPGPLTGEQDRWSATTAWYVSSITSRSGQEQAIFTYADGGQWRRDITSKTTTAVISDRGDEHIVYSSSSSTIVQSYATKKLTSIVLSGESIFFEYHPVSSVVNHTDCTCYNHPFALSRIAVCDIEGRTLKSMAVSTSCAANDGRVVLNALSLKGLDESSYDRWNFFYDTRSTRVSHYSQDWYGFYNGQSSRFADYAPYHFSDVSNSNGGVIPGTPVSAEASYMSLARYKHNGAVSEIRYEGNAIASTSIGVRVKSIITYEKEGCIEGRARSFQYEGPHGDGPISPRPSMYLTSTPPLTFTDMTTGSTTWAFTYHETPVTQGPSVRDTRVYYGKVTETVMSTRIELFNPKRTRTVRYFDTSKSIRSQLTALNNFPAEVSTNYLSNPPYVNIADPMDAIHTYYYDEGPVCPPVMTREEEYAWTEEGTMTLVSAVNYEYDAPPRESVLVDYIATQPWHPLGVGNMSYEYIFHYPVYASNLLTRQKTKESHVQYYLDGRKDSTVVVTSYLTRDANLELPSRVSQTSVTEGGKIRSLELKYADGMDEGYAHTLTNQHYIGAPLVKSYFIEDAPFPSPRPRHEITDNTDDFPTADGIYDSGDSFLEAGQTTPYKKEVMEFANFATSSNRLLPSAHVEYVNGNMAWREDVLSRDHAGNIQQVKETGKPATVILWSYNGKYPVAIIENASLEDVRANLNLPHNSADGFWPVDPVEELTHLQQPSEAQIAAVDSLRTLLPDAQVSTYTFNPGIGISSATDANGVRTSFEYDFAGRLSAVRDADGNLVKDYEYNLLDDDGDGLLSILSRVYRSADASQATTDKSWWNTLGLKQEDIAISASGNGEDDLVTLYISDYLLHDDVRTYLPTPLYTTNGRFISIDNAANAANRLYGSTAPYVFKNYEVSNRDKVAAVALPGYIGSHESTESDGAATSFPKYTWTATGITGGTATYKNWEIVKTVSTDADGRVKTVFKDHVGRTLGTSFGSDAPTYYIYDAKDQLRVVASSGIAMTDTLSMWRYSYDHLGRLSSKGIPGCVRESYEYDNEDHIIAVHRNGVTKQMEYDAFGRMVRAYLSDTNHNHVLLEEHEFDKALEVQSTVAQINADGIIDGYALTSHEYDAKARPVCNVAEYPDGGVLTETITYNFPSEVVSSTFTYSKDGQTDTFTTTSGYDVRGRLINGTSALASGNNTPVSVSTQYHFDEFGRPSGSTTTSGSIVLSSTDTYTLQGWTNNHSVALNGNPLFAEALGYDSGSNPSYTGLITSKQESSNGVADTHHDEYQYDYAGRLSREEKVGVSSTSGVNFSYDPRGNVLQTQEIGSGLLRTWSYLYSGDMLSSETVSTRRTSSTKTFAHDNLSRMISDGHSGTQMEYNHMDLLTKVASSDSILVNYSYLADGTKTSSLKASGEGLVYRGPFTYRRSADGTLALESVVCPEGRLTPNKALLHVTDHLGSVRAVIDGCTGEILEASQYSAYGTRSGDTTTYRDHFAGQEDQMPDFGIPYSDHGARQYSPALRRWMTPDPLSEKYYGLSPYNYCGDNPVNAVDLDGRKIIIGTAFERFQAFFGVDNYVSKVRAQLRKLKKIHPELRNVIATLKRTRNKYLIESTSNRVDKGNGNGYLNHVIYYDPDNSVTNNGNVRSPIIGLAHELGHGFNDENGKSVSYNHEKAKNGDYIEGEKGNRNECFSIYLENIVRNYLNVELRDYDYYNINLFLIEPSVCVGDSSSK